MTREELGRLLERTVRDNTDVDGVAWLRVAETMRPHLPAPTGMDDEELGELIDRCADDEAHRIKCWWVDWRIVARAICAELAKARGETAPFAPGDMVRDGLKQFSLAQVVVCSPTDHGFVMQITHHLRGVRDRGVPCAGWRKATAEDIAAYEARFRAPAEPMTHTERGLLSHDTTNEQQRREWARMDREEAARQSDREAA